jgi:uncharacterized protein YjbJ (UPF0337 family)
MGTSQDMLLEKWHALKGQVRQRWGKITNPDLARLNGKTDELAVVLQRRYGFGKAQAEIEIAHWLSDMDRPNP